MDTEQNKSILKNVVTLFLIVYASLAANNLPDKFLKLFDNTFVKFSVIVLVLMCCQNQHYINAILISIGLLLTLRALSIKKIDDKLSNAVEYIVYKKNNMNNVEKVNN
jgi:hypothetical protein